LFVDGAVVKYDAEFQECYKEDDQGNCVHLLKWWKRPPAF
jgi:hypothetical protein